MRNLYLLLILFSTIRNVQAQDISVNTTGAANSTLSMLEVLQISTTANTKGLHVSHSGTITGIGYGVWSEVTGGSTTNIAGYFNATGGATNNYALIVPNGGGRVGIGTATPDATRVLTVQGIGAASEMIALKNTTGTTTWHINAAGGAGNLNFCETGVLDGRLYLKAGGSIGMGTTTPASSLHLYENTTSTGASAGLTIEQDNTGDAVLQYLLTGGQRWVTGIDNSDGDKFKISSAVDVGSTPKFSISTAGEVTITNHLLVGAPSVPTSTSATAGNIYYCDFNSLAEVGWSNNSVCGAAGSNWTLTSGSASAKEYIVFNNGGARSYKELYSPWIWIPTGTANLSVRFYREYDLENGYDGVYLDYYNGTSYSKVATGDFGTGAYPDNADLTNSTCTGTNNQSCWNGVTNGTYSASTFSPASGAGKWVRFRFNGLEDFADGTGSFKLYNFSVGGNLPAIGGAFATGNIYAEKNVYAGSNVLIGDLAEYFKVDAYSEPGDLICMYSSEGNKFNVSEAAYNPFVIGIHSTNPTVTLNNQDGTPVALTGRVPVKISAENGPIKIGDFLTSASKRGYAMKADKPCYTIGRALEAIASNGKIMCLVESGWYNPSSEKVQSGGMSFIKQGQSNVTVKDVSVKKNSRVFLTFKGRVGTEYWISDISESTFTVSFDNPVQNDLPFDYLVDNANAPALPENDQNNYTKPIIRETHSNGNEEIVKTTPLSKYMHDDMPPPTPSDPSKAWVWSKEKGLILSGAFAPSNTK